MRFALFLLILIPVVELTVLIQVGSKIGSLTTIALVFLTAIVGLTLIRQQGFETSRKAQEKMRRGDYEVIGVIAWQDTLRPDAQEAIAYRSSIPSFAWLLQQYD